MKRAFSASLFLLCVTTGAVTTGIARAQDAQVATASVSPILVKTAEVDALPPAVVGDNGAEYGFVGVGALGVSFVNNAATAAREVTLRATYDGDTQYIKDRGLFAPRVTIAHSYNTFSKAAFHGEAVLVTVEAVRFEDGSTWTAPDAPPSKQQG